MSCATYSQGIAQDIDVANDYEKKPAYLVKIENLVLEFLSRVSLPLLLHCCATSRCSAEKGLFSSFKMLSKEVFKYEYT